MVSIPRSDERSPDFALISVPESPLAAAPIASPARTSVRLEFREDVGHLTLVPPPGKPPTLDVSVLEDLEAAIVDLEASSCRAVVVSSESEKYFCVGANLEVLKKTDADSIVSWVMLGHRVLNRLEDLQCPVIARVDGFAMGGGLELAMCCDLFYAAQTAKFGQTEAKLGFIPGWGGCRRLANRVGVSRAKKLFFTGQVLDGAAAKGCGLVDFCGTKEELDQEVAGTLEAISGNSRYALATFKKLLADGDRDERERNAAAEALHSRGCLLDPGTLERLEAFLNRKK